MEEKYRGAVRDGKKGRGREEQGNPLLIFSLHFLLLISVRRRTTGDVQRRRLGWAEKRKGRKGEKKGKKSVLTFFLLLALQTTLFC